MCRIVFLLYFACLSLNQTVYCLHRDYFELYEDSNMVREHRYLDNNADDHVLCYPSFCVRHFFCNYLNIRKWTNVKDFKYYLPGIENHELLYKLPPTGYVFEGNDPMICLFQKSLLHDMSCLKDVPYYGYLDPDFEKFTPFLEEYLLHFDENEGCSCFWPELSTQAARISDVGYILLQDLFMNTSLSFLIDSSYQRYLIGNNYRKLNEHGITIACICRTFLFSQYYRLVNHIFQYSQEVYEVQWITLQELNVIYEKLQSILNILASEFHLLYEECLHKHPTQKILQERIFTAGIVQNTKESFDCKFKDRKPSCKMKLEGSRKKKSTSPYCALTFKSENDCTKSDEQLLSLPSFEDQGDFFSDFFLNQGLLYNDLLSYEQAIDCFNKSILHENQNKLAYLARAYAHFELRHYEQASNDYKIAKNLNIQAPFAIPLKLKFYLQNYQASISPGNKTEFSKGFTFGAMKGFNQGARDFFPSVWHSLSGIGRGFWTFIREPVEVSREFLSSVELFISVLKQQISEDELKEVPSKIHEMLKQWDSIPDFQKGRYIGEVIGHLGVDALSCTTGIKIARAFRELKYSHASLTFETWHRSSANRKFILNGISKQEHERKEFFSKRCYLHLGQQEKHIPGANNYLKGRSELTIGVERLEQLAAPKLGTGIPTRAAFGEGAYRELIEFEEIIGVHYSLPEKMQAPQKTLTKVAEVHYKSDGGYHIVPVHPKRLMRRDSR